MSGTISSKAVVCTAHLMLLQNPKAILNDWVAYLSLVRAWCAEQQINGVPYYWNTGYSPESDATGRLQ